MDIQSVFKLERRKNWWDKITPEEKDEIERGVKQAESGEVITHKVVMAKYRE